MLELLLMTKNCHLHRILSLIMLICRLQTWLVNAKLHLHLAIFASRLRMCIDAFTQEALSWLDCITQSNEWFVIWLDLSPGIQEKETKMTLRENSTSTAYAANYSHSQAFPPSILDCFQFYWRWSKTGHCEGNNTTPNQTCSNCSPCQIVILQLHRHRTRSAATCIYTHCVCAWTALKPASNHLLEVVYKPDRKPVAKLAHLHEGVSKLVQCKAPLEPAQVLCVNTT